MASKSLETLGSNIKKKLHALGRRPAWLAKESGIAPGNISRILKLESSPTLETMEAISKAFGCEPADLLATDTHAVSNTLLTKLSKLSDDDRRVIEQFADQMLVRIESEKKSKI